MATANKFRKETELVLTGHTYAVRPTLDKMARIESRFGPALPLLRRVGEGNVTQLELSAIVNTMLRGVPNAPREADVPGLIFEQGSVSVSSNIVEFIASGITSDVAQKPDDDNPEAETGNR